ncbi:MAG: hypothetical protein LBG84_09680 [Treponema sp.]|nr:hypothetical protein [Treponema sp.]
MKKGIALLAVILAAGGMVSAQTWGNPGGRAVTVEGTLRLENGVIALASGTALYYVPALERYVGFIEGLKEGARVSVRGYLDGYGALTPAALTINGASYDLSPSALGGVYGGACCYGGGGFGGGGGRRGMGRGHW